jgi:hypothetical protein
MSKTTDPLMLAIDGGATRSVYAGLLDRRNLAAVASLDGDSLELAPARGALTIASRSRQLKSG